MDVLVLGGTRFVGRAVVEAAIASGHCVTTLNRGTGPPTDGVDALVADRQDRDAVRVALGTRSWDAVVDTWSGAPRVVGDAAELLAGRAGHYSYVSSRSVYTWPIPIGLDENGQVVDADPASDDGSDYAASKRGGELAALASFGERALVARAGLILGPYERPGRLLWWLRRMERGGQVVCPGPPDRPIQYIDARDLAEWLLSSAVRGLGGIFNAVSKPGHTTIGVLLDTAQRVTGGAAVLVWVPASVIEEAGIAAWTELPIWAPPYGELAGLHAGDVSLAYNSGLRCRPAGETVADTWSWMQSEGNPPPDASIGLAPETEADLIRRFSPPPG